MWEVSGWEKNYDFTKVLARRAEGEEEGGRGGEERRGEEEPHCSIQFDKTRTQSQEGWEKTQICNILQHSKTLMGTTRGATV